jgi:cytochrome c oxidase cbb3-type subunit 4
MMNENFLSDARSIITVISFVTFIGILCWVYVRKRPADFDEAALLPFADDALELERIKAQQIELKSSHKEEYRG